MSKIISASILSADFANLGEQIRDVRKAGADWLHIDVMDGCFVPNISLGVPVIASIRKSSNIVFDVHLMILDPQRYIQYFCNAGADYLTVHAEATPELEATLLEIKEYGVKTGVSLNPGTPFEPLKKFLHHIDLLLFMGVEPGFGGQKFKPDILPKIRQARAAIDSYGTKTLIQVDGGVNADTVEDIAKAGCDVFVAGSYIFENKHGMEYAVNTLREKSKS